jgi:hypothetical protein
MIQAVAHTLQAVQATQTAADVLTATSLQAAAAPQATVAASGANVQTFTGTLGAAAPEVVAGGKGFQVIVNGGVNGDFINKKGALVRSCDVQKNVCPPRSLSRARPLTPSRTGLRQPGQRRWAGLYGGRLRCAAAGVRRRRRLIVPFPSLAVHCLAETAPAVRVAVAGSELVHAVPRLFPGEHLSLACQ